MATILVIDDELFMLDYVRKILELAGHKVVTASTADAGLSAYRTHKPDLVITDVIMPDKDGLEMIRELLNADPNARIIAISGGGRTGFADALKAAEAFGAKIGIRKPFQPADLVAQVNKVLGG